MKNILYIIFGKYIENTQKACIYIYVTLPIINILCSSIISLFSLKTAFLLAMFLLSMNIMCLVIFVIFDELEP